MDNFTGETSPYTLEDDWPWIWMVFFLVIFTLSGTVTNGFFVATFFASPELMKRGNLFLACLGLSDLIITAMVMPCVIWIMMTDMTETNLICQAMSFLTGWSTYAYNVFFMLVSIDMYTRLSGGYTHYAACMIFPICMVAFLTFVITLVAAAVGVYQELDYDYCFREHNGNFWYRAGTSMTFYLIPTFVTTTLLLRTSFVMRDDVLGYIRYKRFYMHERDRVITNLHLGCYCFFVCAWIPFLTVVNLYPNTSVARYNTLMWLGLIRSGVTSLIYSALNEFFRRAFQHLVVYFCCKGDTPFPFRRHNNANKQTRAQNVIVVSELVNSTESDPPIGCTL